jgi:cytochrome c2
MCKIPNKHSRLFTFLMMAVSLGGYSEMLYAADAARGKLLYETNCGECHTKSVSGRPNRVAKSVSDIRKWVIQWESYKDYRWSDKDIEDVTQYLNNRFYKYKNSPGAANDR